jgi:hypothetical protein
VVDGALDHGGVDLTAADHRDLPATVGSTLSLAQRPSPVIGPGRYRPYTSTGSGELAGSPDPVSAGSGYRAIARPEARLC